MKPRYQINTVICFLFCCHTICGSWSKEKIRIVLKVFTPCTLHPALLFIAILSVFNICLRRVHCYCFLPCDFSAHHSNLVLLSDLDFSYSSEQEGRGRFGQMLHNLLTHVYRSPSGPNPWSSLKSRVLVRKKAETGESFPHLFAPFLPPKPEWEAQHPSGEMKRSGGVEERKIRGIYVLEGCGSVWQVEN